MTGRLGVLSYVVNNVPGSAFLWQEEPTTWVIRRETNNPAIYEGNGMKVPKVTRMRPETARTNRG